MLPKLMKPFNFKLEAKQEGKNLKVAQKTSRGGYDDNCFRSSSNETSSSTGLAVGLRVIMHSANSKGDHSHSHVVVKSAASRMGQQQQQVSTHDYCFLKTCNLCNKKFSPDKDIYMYRGDQGFCSIECRDRQIVLDEMRDLETYNKQKRAYQYHGHCCSDARKETRSILEDLQLQRHKSKTVPSNQKHWAIVS